LVAGFQGALDQKATTAQLEQVAELIPEEWLAPAATGTPAQCVAAIRRQFDLGCDGVILHGASPTDLEPIVREYARTRDHARFAHLPANPALAPRLVRQA
jgi:alkanesulfonate monooxygenase SsuD/methylene tetrahydromethanopterin reductase-like flavin-dependent oxidoreductase (luciferase family)